MNKPMNTATKTAASARAKARRVMDDAEDDVRATASRVSEKAERVRRTAAARATDLAEDLDAAADDAGSFARRTVSGLSDRARDLGDGLRSRNLSEMVEDAQGFARRNPAVMVAGAVLVGLLISRAAAPRVGRARRA